MQQQRFVIDARGRRRRPLAGAGLPEGAGADAAPACELRDRAVADAAHPGACAPWVFANAGAHGYYRTAYPPGRAARAGAARRRRDSQRRSGCRLLDDEWALVRAGRHSAGEYLTLAAGYGRERASGVLEEVARRLASIGEDLTTAATRTRFEGFSRSLLRPLLDEIGFAAAPADTEDRRALRAALIEALGTIGERRRRRRQVARGARRALAGRAPLDPTVAGAIVEGGRGARRRARCSTRSLPPRTRGLTGRAVPLSVRARRIPGSRRWSIAGLGYALSPKLRSQDAALYLSQFLDQPLCARARVGLHHDALGRRSSRR